MHALLMTCKPARFAGDNRLIHRFYRLPCVSDRNHGLQTLAVYMNRVRLPVSMAVAG